jgi:hypothetical protein
MKNEKIAGYFEFFIGRRWVFSVEISLVYSNEPSIYCLEFLHDSSLSLINPRL